MLEKMMMIIIYFLGVPKKICGMNLKNYLTLMMNHVGFTWNIKKTKKLD